MSDNEEPVEPTNEILEIADAAAAAASDTLAVERSAADLTVAAPDAESALEW